MSASLSFLSWLVVRGSRKALGAVGLGRLWERCVTRHYLRSDMLRAVPRSSAKLFQIVGVPRSGTTVLAGAFDSHPAVVCLIEPYWGLETMGYFEVSDDADPTKALKYASGPHHVLTRLCLGRRYQLVGFKECYRAEHEPLPSEAFLKRNAREGSVERTLAIVRDPRDVWLSVSERPSNIGKPLSNEFTRAWNSFGAWVTQASLPRVKYEELAVDPEATLQRACEALELDFDPCMLEIGRKCGRGDERAQAGGPVLAGSVGRHLEELPAASRDFIESDCGELMREFGYVDRG